MAQDNYERELQIKAAAALNQQENSQMYGYQTDAGELKDVLSITLDNSNLLQEIENSLRGRILTINQETGAREWKQISEPAMNEQGIQAVLMEVASRLGKNVILGNIRTEEQKRIVRSVHKQITKLMAVNADKYEIEPGRRDSILWQISHIIYFSITRSVGDGERNKIYKRSSTTEHLHKSDHTVGLPKKKFSLFGR